MTEKQMSQDEQTFYEEMAEIADFIHDRIGADGQPLGFNNTPEEYAEQSEGEA